jgi:hypothetical protein
LAVSFCISDFKRDVLSLNITKLAEPLPKSVKKSGGWEFRGQNANSVEFNGLLRVRRERPCCRSTSEKRDEISSLHVCFRKDHAMCNANYKRSFLIGV